LRAEAARAVVAVVVSCAAVGATGCGQTHSGGDGETSSPRPPRGAVHDLRVAVDPRVELLSVLCRIAGVPPYQQSTTPYARAVDAHFAPYARDPAVEATRALARQHGISHDAPVELAAYLDGSLRPTRPLHPLPLGLDARWKRLDLDTYLAAVRRFAAVSRFDSFFRSQSGYHRAVERSLSRYLAGRRVVDWFDATFGRRRSASYRVVPGLLTGGFGFGTVAQRRSGRLDVAPVVFLESPDARGVPHPTPVSLEYLVHELAHSYVNPLFDAQPGRMRASALPVFRRVEAAMRAQAYTSYPIMVDESVVRAITVLFLRDRATDGDVRRSLDKQRELSFFWTGALVEALDAERSPSSGRLEPASLLRTTREVLTEWRQEQR
jgi:uncharacterized protein DUF4932